MEELAIICLYSILAPIFGFLVTNVVKKPKTKAWFYKLRHDAMAYLSNIFDSKYFFLWKRFHPHVKAVSRKLFAQGYYALSVKAAIGKLSALVNDIVKKQTGKELEGDNLIYTAFSSRRPIIAMENLSTKSGRNLQLGYMNTFKALTTEIKTGLDDINQFSKDDATSLLAIISTLIYKIESGQQNATAKPISDEEIVDLLQQAEGENLEFKSFAFYNRFTREKDTAITKGIIETVAAFLNTSGGILMIGIEDGDHSVIGLEQDYQVAEKKRPNRDGFEQCLRNTLIDILGSKQMAYYKIMIRSLDGKEICIIVTEASREPVYCSGALFVRAGNETRKYSTQEAVEYIKNVFGK